MGPDQICSERERRLAYSSEAHNNTLGYHSPFDDPQCVPAWGHDPHYSRSASNTSTSDGEERVMASTLAKQVATANRRARDRGLEGSLSTLDWQRALTFFEGRCAYCDSPASTLDHFQPMMLGGPTTRSNAILCCISCNERKGATAPDQLSLFMPPERVAHIRGYLEAQGSVRQQSWHDLCIREPSFAAMDRKTTWLTAYCEQQAHHHETLCVILQHIVANLSAICFTRRAARYTSQRGVELK